MVVVVTNWQKYFFDINSLVGFEVPLFFGFKEPGYTPNLIL